MLRLWRLRRISTLFARGIRQPKNLRKGISFLQGYKIRFCPTHVSNSKQIALKQEETLNGLPKAIRTSIAHHLFFPIIQNVHLFQGVSRNLLFQLVPEMEAEYFPPKQDMILQNEAPTDLYIIVSGAVELIAQIEELEQAIAGELLGEIGALCGRPQPFSVRITEISQILRQSRTALMNIFRSNPEDEQIIMNNLLLVSLPDYVQITGKSTILIA
ncbi:hypothetical protein K7X08_033048 [Anisodus acutangulus]|uniref:Potassium channel n=1 Tax=Anisodus acutangulus TaxID=402998 RepID=A0A9Q1M4W1_9SOLA|nr:hypothetical protein K7X08_033048 [Anisodus acutangulus]